MTDPRQPLIVQQGTPEHRQLLTRFWQCHGVTGDARDDHAHSSDLVLRRAAAHKHLMAALRRLDEGRAA